MLLVFSWRLFNDGLFPAIRLPKLLKFWLLLLVGMTPLVRAQTPTAPTNCVVTAIGNAAGDASIYIGWSDNSTNETQWRIEYRVNNSEFSLLATASSVSTSTVGNTSVTWSGGVSNTTYQFRVSAFNGVTYSATATSLPVKTDVFTLTSTPIPGQTKVQLSWPNIEYESGYQILYKLATDSSYSVFGLVGANITSATLTSPTLEATKTYSFIVQPYTNNTIVGSSAVATATVDGITSKTGTSGTPGGAFSHTFTQVSGSSSTVTSRQLTNTPNGLTFNTSTGVLSGTYPTLGNYLLNYSVTFANGGILTQTFYIRVRPPAGAPVLGSVIPAWNATVGASRDTPLAGTFTDVEAESAVRVNTTLGNMDFILFDTATPATVTNFMNYVNAGKYTDVVFHRSIAGFVIQGGGFKGTGNSINFTSVVTNPTLVNEPGIANELGTISMAKLGGDPNSATSQFFVSLGDNRANLDYQNGGFTVFGRVAGNGMAVAQSISTLPSGTYNLVLDGSSFPTSFSGFPMNAAILPSSMDQTKLVKINSVASVPTLSYSITGNTNPSVTSASVLNGQLHLVGLTCGQTTLTVTATDLDNLSNSQTVVVNLNDTFSTWAARNSFPNNLNGNGQNPDGDAWNNLQEYAFFGDPAVANPPTQTVSQGITGTSPAYLTLTFPVRKFTQGLTYAVEANNGLSGSWTEIWKTSNGFSQVQVLSALDQADRTVLTLKDTTPISGSSKRFLRTKIVQE